MARQLRHAIGDRPVIVNARFDIRILKQTAAAHSDPADWLEELTVYCAMELAAGYYGATNRYGTISLACAASQAGLTWEGQAHSGDRRRTDDGRGGKRYCCISSGTAADGTAENLTAWPVYRNHLRYPDVNPPAPLSPHVNANVCVH